MADKDKTKTPDDPTGPARAAAEQTVEQARKAFEDVMGMAQKTISGMETSSAQMQDHVRALTRETLDFAGATTEATFSLVERLARAKDPQEAIAIQKAFVEEQMERLGRQARSMGDGAIKAAQDFTKPFER